MYINFIDGVSARPVSVVTSEIQTTVSYLSLERSKANPNASHQTDGLMHAFIKHLIAIVMHLGPFGLIIVGVLDSSFLFMPLGNDLLVIGMTAQAHNAWDVPFYAGVAAVGSVLGCALLDLVARKGGEEGLDKHVPKKRLDYVKNKIKKEAAPTLAVASIMPPPFPFTPFVAAAAALEYPRKKLLSVIGVARFVRFLAEAILALYFGRKIIRVAKSPTFEYAMIGLICIAVAGSIVSVVSLIQKSKAAKPVPSHSSAK